MDAQDLISLLKAEVKPALGCTEPAAVAFAVAKARDFLGGRIDQVKLSVSGNIFKNAMAVTIPGTPETGIPMAAALGLLRGNPARGLEVLTPVQAEDVEEARRLLARGVIKVKIAQTEGFYIRVRAKGERGRSEVVVKEGHMNLVRAVVNDTVVVNQGEALELARQDGVCLRNYSLAALLGEIERFPLEEISFLREGLEMNLAIARKGLELRPGLGMGAGVQALMVKGLMGRDLQNRARMLVAAACDARMAGVDLPVMSTMGSGNQGIGAIVPVAAAAEELGVTEERTLRALALSHLVTAYIKAFTGKLSTMCGCAVAAGAGSAAAVAWLLGGDARQIAGAVTNILGNLSGMICDGAKGGCALKLSTSASEAVLAARLALQDVIISQGDGIIAGSVEQTIQNVGWLSSTGMACTEKAILELLIAEREKGVG